MKLLGLSINGFKSLYNNDIPVSSFQDINLFIGKNNTGKSNVLHAIYSLGNRSINLKDISVFPTSDSARVKGHLCLSDRDLDSTLESIIRYTLANTDLHFELENILLNLIGQKRSLLKNISLLVIGSKDSSNNFKNYQIITRSDGIDININIEGKDKDLFGTDLLYKLNDHDLFALKKEVLFSITSSIRDRIFYLSSIRDPAHVDDPVETFSLDERSRRLNQLIYSHKNKETPEYFHFCNEIGKIFPEIVGVLTPPQGKKIAISIHEQGFEQGQYFELSQVSAGILEALSIVARIIFSPPGSIICIEEPEIHFHHFALKQIWDLIRNASKNEKQFFITTHSDYFIKRGDTEIDRIWHFQKGEDGKTVIKHLENESQVDDIMKDLYSY